MLQISLNQPGESQENTGRSSAENEERERYEGFEGMNFEQVRKPYNNKKSIRIDDYLDYRGSGTERA